MRAKASEELVTNSKAFYHYEILEKIEAGILLVGTEVKSLRQHGGNLSDSYVIIQDYAAILKNASIAPYRFGNIHNHAERRDRKLLLHKKELLRLKQTVEPKGLTLVPLSLYLKGGYVKVALGIAKGKRSFDKRESIKEREHKTHIARALKREHE